MSRVARSYVYMGEDGKPLKEYLARPGAPRREVKEVLTYVSTVSHALRHDGSVELVHERDESTVECDATISTAAGLTRVDT